jgi:hypothetical protein
MSRIQDRDLLNAADNDTRVTGVPADGVDTEAAEEPENPDIWESLDDDTRAYLIARSHDDVAPGGKPLEPTDIDIDVEEAETPPESAETAAAPARKRARFVEKTHVRPLLMKVDVAALPEEVRKVWALKLSNDLIVSLSDITKVQGSVRSAAPVTSPGSSTSPSDSGGDGTAPTKFRGLPLVSLQQALQSLAPEIICFIKGTFRTDPAKRPPYWLLADAASTDPIDQKRIVAIMGRWLRAVYPNTGGRFIAEKRLGPEHLEWAELDLAELTKTEPETVGSVLPDLLARYLVRNQAELWLHGSNGATRGGRLHLAPSTEYGADLITLSSEGSPEGHYDGKQKKGPYPFSYGVGLRKVSLPGSTDYFISLSIGVHRWVTRVLVKEGSGPIRLPFRQGSTVYAVRDAASWSSQHTDADVRTLLRLVIAPSKEGGQWKRHLPSVLTAIESNFQERIPEAADFLANPDRYPNFLLTYNNKMRTKGLVHKVGAGVEQIDRFEAFNDLSNLMPPGVVPVEPWQKRDRLGKNRNLQRVFPSPSAVDFKKLRDDQRQRGLERMARDGQCTIEIWTDQDMAKCAVEVLTEWFPKLQLAAIDQQTGLPIYASCPELRVVGATIDPKYWTLLDERIMAASKDRLAVRQKFERIRADEIGRALASARGVTGVLVQMPNYREAPPEYRDRDPKMAVRLGLVYADRVSQFITPLVSIPEGISEEKADSIRKKNKGKVANALRDLLRQMDFSLDDVYRKANKARSLPDEMDLIAMWVVRLQKRRGLDKYGIRGLPMLLYVPYGSLNRQVYLPASGGWQAFSLREAMLHLAQLTEDDSYGSDEEDCRRFFAQVIQVLPIERDAMLLVNRDNMGEVWREVSDGNLTQSDLSVSGSIGQALAAQPKIRVARIRTNINQVPPVTPQPPTMEGEEYTASFGQFLGLYGSSDPNVTNVFYSIQSRPRTQQQVNGQRQVDLPTTQSWNPGTVEITMANIGPNDEPFEWAWVAHRLREDSPHFDDATSMPEPLHALSKLTEYVLRLEASDEPRGADVDAPALDGAETEESSE